VWAMNFASLNNNNQVTDHPDTVMYCITNAPSIIESSEIIIYSVSSDGSNKVIIHEYKESNAVKYPNDKAQYTYTIPNFQQLRQNISAGNHLERAVNIKYKSLAGGKSYKFNVVFSLKTNETQWCTISENAT